ncbi:hypothetical protein A3B61_03455 [Candidatus Peribacteria bacterium RIFCSPLOWO2_01_FULL_53_10]|nr:MAG: hypothetical protein A3B61_03455 [Candidatus Peribacteria bacterium RIFCSPLOWO2_01_FULL_53_10]
MPIAAMGVTAVVAFRTWVHRTAACVRQEKSVSMRTQQIAIIGVVRLQKRRAVLARMLLLPEVVWSVHNPALCQSVSTVCVQSGDITKCVMPLDVPFPARPHNLPRILCTWNAIVCALVSRYPVPEPMPAMSYSAAAPAVLLTLHAMTRINVLPLQELDPTIAVKSFPAGLMPSAKTMCA